MQSLAINQRKIEYADYLGLTDILVDGKKTGEKQKSYSTPKEYWIYVSPARGETDIDPFGVNQDYQKTMSTCDMDCPFTENTVLWVDKTSAEGEPDYRVSLVARGLTSIRYAITKNV